MNKEDKKNILKNHIGTTVCYAFRAYGRRPMYGGMTTINEKNINKIAKWKHVIIRPTSLHEETLWNDGHWA